MKRSTRPCVEMSLDAARTSACATLLSRDRKGAVLLLTAFLLFAATVSAQPPTLQRAEALWAARNYESAKNAFEALVKANPKNPLYRTRYGRLLLERFNPKEAADLFQEALEIDKNFAPALLGMALVAADGFERK